MKNQDRSMKILLALLVAGVWGLLLRPGIAPTPVAAQSSTQRAPRYALAIRYRDYKRGLSIQTNLSAKHKPDYETWIFAYQLEEAVKIGTSRGWRVHTVVPADSGLTVLFEK